MIIEIVRGGIIENEDRVRQLMNEYGQVIVPSEDESCDMTHWWVIRDECADMVSLGTPESFTTYIGEQNDGAQ